jgi:hypothetical protein
MKPSLDEAREFVHNPKCSYGNLDALTEQIAVLMARREREARVEELRWVSSESTVSYEQIESRIRDLEAGK